MYKHLQLRFLQNVEDATGIVVLMKRCKATYDTETRYKTLKMKSKGNTTVWLTNKKGHNLKHQTELPVPDTWCWSGSLNGPNYCTKKTSLY